MEAPLMQTDMPDVTFLRRGKVRDMYDLGESLLLVATDRISAFDVVLPNGVPGKGKILTEISLYWFGQLRDVIENHLRTAEVGEYPDVCRKYRPQLEGRSMLVKKARQIPVECIVRGYLSGSGWKEYQAAGTVCGIRLPAGLVESARLDAPIFTPSTKAEAGHDVNIPYEETERIVGKEMAARLRDVSLRLYEKAGAIAERKGIIIADTKFEFGVYEDRLILIDEVLTPDSSRFWSAAAYTPGKGQDSYDKQIVRDYLLTLDWDRQDPGPLLPDTIVEKSRRRYEEIRDLIVSGSPVR